MRASAGRVSGAGGLVLALLLSAVPAEAADGSTIGAAGVGDTVFPGLGNGGYDVAEYLIDMTYDGGTRLVDATVSIRAEATQALSRFNLDAVGLDLRSVTVDGAPATFVQDGEELVITPAALVRTGREFTVEVSYLADPRRVPPPAGGFVATADGFATVPQPAGAHSVFPSNDHPSDKAAYTVRITAPVGLLGVANGRLVDSATNPDGSTTSVYRSRDPLAAELVQISVGRYSVVDRGERDGVLLRDVVPTARLPLTLPALNLTPAQLEWAESRLGPMPQEAYGLLIADTDDPEAFDFTGLETQTLTIYKPAFLLQAEDKIGSHMMHEMVHNWFGNSVTPADWSDLWINEGHADLYGLEYRYERGWPDSAGNTTLADRMRATYAKGDQWRASSGPVARPTAANLFDNQRYTGAVLVLFALRERVGPDAFAQLERAFLDRYRHDVAGTEDFIDVATTTSGDAGVRPFLEGWLYGTKTPPMPNHPDWTVDPVPPPAPPTAPAPPGPPTPPTTPGHDDSLRSDRVGS